MQMLSCGSGASVSSNTQPLTSVNIVTNLDRNTTQVHVSALVLAAIVSVVLNGNGETASSIRIVVDFCNLAFVFRCQNIYTKVVRIARSFAKSNNLYGVKFVCYLYDKWVFRIMTEPGLVVDIAYPPTYIIVTEESEVRYSTPEEGYEVYQLTHIL